MMNLNKNLKGINYISIFKQENKKRKRFIYLLHWCAKESRALQDSFFWLVSFILTNSLDNSYMSLFRIINRWTFFVRAYNDLLFFGFFLYFGFLIIFRKHITVDGVPHWSLFLEQSARSKVVIRPSMQCHYTKHMQAMHNTHLSTTQWHASIR